MAKSVFCICGSEAQASEIVTGLKGVGFGRGDISALLPDRTGTKDFAHEHHTKAPEGAVAGSIVGGVVLAAVGWLATAGVIGADGFQPIVERGPAVLVVLSALAVGSIIGGFIGALAGSRLPKFVATRYSGKIAEGNILLSVHCDRDSEMREALRIISDAGAANVAVCGEADVRNRKRRRFSEAMQAG